MQSKKNIHTKDENTTNNGKSLNTNTNNNNTNLVRDKSMKKLNSNKIGNENEKKVNTFTKVENPRNKGDQKNLNKTTIINNGNSQINENLSNTIQINQKIKNSSTMVHKVLEVNIKEKTLQTNSSETKEIHDDIEINKNTTKIENSPTKPKEVKAKPIHLLKPPKSNGFLQNIKFQNKINKFISIFFSFKFFLPIKKMIYLNLYNKSESKDIFNNHIKQFLIQMEIKFHQKIYNNIISKITNDNEEMIFEKKFEPTIMAQNGLNFINKKMKKIV